MNSLLIGPGLPGGMMGSLMSDLEKNLESINKGRAKRGKKPMTQEKLLLKLFDEVAHVWPRVGYPPLVTPFSQYVKNLACEESGFDECDADGKRKRTLEHDSR